MRRHLTYANVMVTILAFIVLGGAAVAGVKLARNSVGTKQIKNGAVTAAKIKQGAVDSSKLSPSALSGYAKSSDLSSLAAKADLNGLLRAPVGPDQLGPVPAAGLTGAIYNVGSVGGGVDCQGTSSDEFPNNKLDDLDFESVAFDSGGLAHTEPGAVPDCYNGFAIPRAGKYLVTAFVDWEPKGGGDREFGLVALLPGKACCQVLAVDGRAAAAATPTGQPVSAIASLPTGATVFVQAKQNSGASLELAGGGMQIAWLGS